MAIRVPYLLAIDVSIARGADGSFFADTSWARDLLRHLTYIDHLTYMAPVLPSLPPADWQQLPSGAFRVVGYPAPSRGLGGYLTALRIIPILVREIRRASIVHTGVAGHPIPTGWLAIPIARLFNRKIIVIVESAFWRIPAGRTAGRYRRLRARLYEAINRSCMRQVDYAAYAHASWQRQLPSPRARGGTLFQASWIEAQDVQSAAEVERRWSQRVAHGGALRFLFAGRLIRDKGTAVLVDAVEKLSRAGKTVEIDIIGVGAELETLKLFAEANAGACRVRVLDPVPYGQPFFELLRQYDCVLVPSLSDEQPRIVYDAAAQGVPALASLTPGLQACIEDKVTGLLVPQGDAGALAEAVGAAKLEDLARWGAAARAFAASNTHEHMHECRARDLEELLSTLDLK